MYAKLFRQMYHGTLATDGPWEALITFQQMLILADKDGVVDMTQKAIARETTIPLEIITQGIEVLEKPDPESRTPDEEGRRITLLSEHRNWGWKITNYAKYRQLQREEDRRAYHRSYWHKRKADSTETQQPQQTQPNSPIAEAEAEAYAYAEAKAVGVRAPTASTESNPDTSYEVTEAIKIGYPPGTYRGNAWILAQREIRTLLSDGIPRETLESAALAYRAQQDAAGNVGTKFILSPLTFFKEGNWKGPFPLPKTKGETARDANIDASIKWLENAK